MFRKADPEEYLEMLAQAQWESARKALGNFKHVLQGAIGPRDLGARGGEGVFVLEGVKQGGSSTALRSRSDTTSRSTFPMSSPAGFGSESCSRMRRLG